MRRFRSLANGDLRDSPDTVVLIGACGQAGAT